MTSSVLNRPICFNREDPFQLADGIITPKASWRSVLINWSDRLEKQIPFEVIDLLDLLEELQPYEQFDTLDGFGLAQWIEKAYANGLMSQVEVQNLRLFIVIVFCVSKIDQN